MPRSRKTSIGDMPLAVPLHRVCIFEPGLYRGVLLQFIPLGKLEVLYGIFHLQNRIDRALLRSRHIADHVDHAFEVLVIDRLVPHTFAHLHQLCQGHLASRSGRHVESTGGSRLGPVLQGHAKEDLHRLLLLIQVDKTCHRAGEGDAHALCDGFRRDAVFGCLVLVRVEDELFLVRLDVPVHVDHPLGLLEDVADLTGNLDLPSLCRGRRSQPPACSAPAARRYLHHLDPGAVAVADFLEARPDPLGDVMALGLSVPLGNEIDLDIGHICSRAQEIVAHEAVEIDRAPPFPRRAGSPSPPARS